MCYLKIDKLRLHANIVFPKQRRHYVFLCSEYAVFDLRSILTDWYYRVLLSLLPQEGDIVPSTGSIKQCSARNA